MVDILIKGEGSQTLALEEQKRRSHPDHEGKKH